MKFIGAWRQGDIVLEVATAQMPVDIRIECARDLLRWTEDHRASREKAVGLPCPPTAIYVGIPRSYNHAEVLAARSERCGRFANAYWLRAWKPIAGSMRVPQKNSCRNHRNGGNTRR